jgi:hypothetical protein
MTVFFHGNQGSKKWQRQRTGFGRAISVLIPTFTPICRIWKLVFLPDFQAVSGKPEEKICTELNLKK